ncbi:PLC-like phosphodiesterase [Mycena polygramma]|nr:PLC-like phosphodiesterase [Mycena polygramma]
MLRFRPTISNWTSRISYPYLFSPFYIPRTPLRRGIMTPSRLPDCWGHRGASARFPENTLASFEAAIRDGAEGIESDVHVSLDDVVVMFHDPELQRTTDSTGRIRERDWYGADGMEHVRTVKEPHQSIPTFAETVSLLMLPENQHVNFNVDVKVQNTPARLFALMHQTISSHPNWETLLAPRILLGLWHPSFLEPAKDQLPYCRRSYIGNCPTIARKYFWNDCEVFSISFAALTSSDGQRFRQECKAGGKKVMVWTVNEPDHMMEAVRWEVDVILTDVTRTWLDLRSALSSDYEKITAQYSRFFLWTTLRFYAPVRYVRVVIGRDKLERVAGPFDKLKVNPAQVALAYMMAWWLGVKL